MLSRPRRSIITTSFTSPWKKCKKRWTRDTKTSSSIACVRILKPTRRRKLRRSEAIHIQFLVCGTEHPQLRVGTNYVMRHQKYGKRDDEEIDHSGQEHSVVERRRVDLLRVGQRFKRFAAQVDELC